MQYTMTMYSHSVHTLGNIYIHIYIYILKNFFKPKFKENLIRIKIGFCFFSFPYKLNYFNFCCYFFSELMSIFFILFLFRYFVCEDVEINKL